MTPSESIAEQEATIVRALGIPSYVLGVPSQISTLDRQVALGYFRALLLDAIKQAPAAPRSEETDGLQPDV